MQLHRPNPTFLDAPFRALGEVRAGEIVIIGAAHGTPYPVSRDVAYDVATGSAGAPAAIRRAAVQSSSNLDHWDFDLGGPLLADGRDTLADCGDLLTAAADGPGNRRRIEQATRTLVAAGAIPVLLGGDDSVPIPFHRAFADLGPVAILQMDAHIDWRDAIGGERDGYSSTMRRASKLGFVKAMVQVGARGVGSARRAEVEAAVAWGARIVTATQARCVDPAVILGGLPEHLPVVIAVDCDVFDPAVLPAVNAPTPGGLWFHEMAGIFRLVAAARQIVGLSLVELVPAADPHGISATVAARLILNAIGMIARRDGGAIAGAPAPPP
jgi:agmatinase